MQVSKFFREFPQILIGIVLNLLITLRIVTFGVYLVFLTNSIFL